MNKHLKEHVKERKELVFDKKNINTESKKHGRKKDYIEDVKEHLLEEKEHYNKNVEKINAMVLLSEFNFYLNCRRDFCFLTGVCLLLWQIFVIPELSHWCTLMFSGHIICGPVRLLVLMLLLWLLQWLLRWLFIMLLLLLLWVLKKKWWWLFTECFLLFEQLHLLPVQL